MKFVAAFIVLTAAATAHAGPTRAQCVAASEDAQLRKIKGQLHAARDELLVCSNDACPRVVKQDCSSWLDEVDRAMPTIVFGARDPRGQDLTDVRIAVDGVPLVQLLDGKAVAIDPGLHVFRFETNGAPVHEEQMLVREGDKSRNITVTLGEAPTPQVEVQKPSLPRAPLLEQPPPKDERHGPSVATWIVGGVGLATLAAAGVIGTVSLLQRSSLYDSCGSKGACQQSDIDQVYLLYNLSYGGAAIGGALVVTSIILLLATKPSRAAHAAAFVSPTLGGLSVSGRF